jgi:RNA polymerase sigma factor (sigma-70 family)
MPARPPDDPTVLAGRLYDEYGASLYRYALMLLADAAGAEDAVQQVFTSLMRGAGTRIEQDAHYLRRAVRNECYSMLRRARRQVHLHADVTRQSGDLLEPIRGVATTLDERLLLERAIRALSPDEREVIHLHVPLTTASRSSCRTAALMPARCCGFNRQSKQQTCQMRPCGSS